MVALLVLAAASATSAGLYFISRQRLREAVLALRQAQSQALAEGGIFKALWYLKGNGSRDIRWRPNSHEEAWPGRGSYAFRIEDAGSDLRIVSTGRLEGNGQAATVEAVVSYRFPPAFRWALFSEEMIQVADRPVRVRGGIASRDRVLESPFARIDRSESFLNIGLPRFHGGSVEEKIAGYDRILGKISQAREAVPGRIFDKMTMPKIPPEGVLYIQGSAALEGGSGLAPFRLDGPAVLAASGRIYLKGAIEMDKVVLLAQEGVEIRDGAKLSRVEIYSPQHVAVKGRASLQGAVFGRREILIQEDASIRPSSLVYCDGLLERGSLMGSIRITGNARVSGTVISHVRRHLSAVSNRMEAVVAKGALVQGIVLAENELTLAGTLLGSAACRMLRGRLLEECFLDRTQLPEDYVLPEELSEKTDPRFTILRWRKISG